MKPYIIAIISIFLAAFVCRANPEIQGEPVKLAPYQVKEKPFGFLGVRHATLVVNMWKFVVGMNSVRYLQINELEPSSPGVAAGVLPGDRLISIDGVSIENFGVRKLRRMGNEVEVGRKIVVEILRPSDGSRRTIEVIVAPKPKQPNKAPVLTPASVTPAADAPVASDAGTAHVTLANQR